MDVSKLVAAPHMFPFTLGQMKQISIRLRARTGMIFDREHTSGEWNGFHFVWEYVANKGWLVGCTAAPKGMEKERVEKWIEIVFSQPEMIDSMEQAEE